MAFLFKFLLLLSVICIVLEHGGCVVFLDMFEKGCNGGGWTRDDIIEDNVCYSWPSAGGNNRGVRMRYGSCLIIYRYTSCSVEDMILTSKNCVPAHIYSAKPCSLNLINLKCSPGNWVKAIAVSGNGIAEGLSIQCYSGVSPESATLNETYSLSNSKMTSPLQLTCPLGIRGINYELDETLGVVQKTSPSCTNEGIANCPVGQVVVGITVSIEEHTELIKNVSVSCAPETIAGIPFRI